MRAFARNLRKHLHNEYYRFAREVAPTHSCYEEIADTSDLVAWRESLVEKSLSDRFDGGSWNQPVMGRNSVRMQSSGHRPVAPLVHQLPPDKSLRLS